MESEYSGCTAEKNSHAVPYNSTLPLFADAAGERADSKCAADDLFNGEADLFSEGSCEKRTVCSKKSAALSDNEASDKDSENEADSLKREQISLELYDEDEKSENDDTDLLFSEDKLSLGDPKFDLEHYAAEAGSVSATAEDAHLFRCSFNSGSSGYGFNWPGKQQAAIFAGSSGSFILKDMPEKGVNAEATSNICIEGSSAVSLKLLQKDYRGKVRLIFADPPADSEASADFGRMFLHKRQKNLNRRQCIHAAWCSQIYASLLSASELLEDRGIIFISIGDTMLSDMMQIASEVFGRENLLGIFPRLIKKTGKASINVTKSNDFIIAYAKSAAASMRASVNSDKNFKFKDVHFQERGAYKLNQPLDYNTLQYSPSLDYPITIDGEVFYPGSSYEKYAERRSGNYQRLDWSWRWSRKLFEFGLANDFVVVKRRGGKARIYTKTYQKACIKRSKNGFFVAVSEKTRPISTLEFIDKRYSSDNAKKDLERLFADRLMEYSKPVSLLEDLIKASCDSDSLVLDMFGDSAVMAQAVFNLNSEDGGSRRFIILQSDEELPKNSAAYKSGYKKACDLGQERIRRYIFGRSDLTQFWQDMGFSVYRAEKE